MRYRPFGSTGLTTSEVGFGCARLGGVFQGSSRTEVIALLRGAHDAGITFFDTADMYTQGESERLVGEAFQGRRHQVLIATKVGYRLPAQKQLAHRIKPLVKPLVRRLGLTSRQLHTRVRGSVSEQDFSPAYIASAVESSLRRLRTDYIDVYQLHDPPDDVLQRGEFVETLQRLQDQGKIRSWGVAPQQPEQALAALAHPSLGSVQIGLSALEQSALDAAIPAAEARGIAVIGRQVFASGLLTRSVERVQLEELDVEPTIAVRKHAQLARYASIVDQCGRSRAELALQFALGCRAVSVVLLGASRPDQLAESLRAYEARGLSPEEDRLLAASRR